MTTALDRARRRVLAAAEKYQQLREKQSARPFRPGERVPYGGRVFDGKEVRAAVAASLDFWLTAGPNAAQLESALARRLGVKYCSLVNSGSSANLLAFAALCDASLGARAIRPGDEVITPAACFPTTLAPIIQYGAVPVFVDMALPQYNIDVSVLERALGKRTKAVFLAHTLGNPFDVAAVKRFCRRHGLWLIEDNCDALGARYRLGGKWAGTGSFGDIATSSFYPAHHITTGEGGAVYTSDPRLHRIINSLRDWGRDCWCQSGSDGTCGKRFTGRFGTLPAGYDHKYVYSRFGYNLKMTDLQAAIGLAQLEKLGSFCSARRRNWKYLRRRLDRFSRWLMLPEPERNSDPSWFGFIVSVRPGAGFSRTELTGFLESRGIQTRTLFAGNILRHPCADLLRSRRGSFRVCGGLENSDFIVDSTFWMGVYPGLDRARLDHMVRAVADFIGGKR